jgi:hypothetical protein
MHVLVIKHVPPGPAPPASLKQNNNGCLHPVNSSVTLDSVQDDVKDENGMLGTISSSSSSLLLLLLLIIIYDIFFVVCHSVFLQSYNPEEEILLCNLWNFPLILHG